MSSTFNTVEGINGLILDSINNNQPVIDSLTTLIEDVAGSGPGGGSINLLSDCYKNSSNMSVGHKANVNDFNNLCLTISNTPMTNANTAQTGSTYIGQSSGQNTTINAGRNTATGALTLSSCESQGNCAYGFDNSSLLTTGNHLCSYGEGTSKNLTTGSDNCIYGYQSAITLVTGSNNCLYGHNCDVSDPNAQNRIGLGANVLCNVDNSITTIPNLETIPSTNTLINPNNVRLVTYNNLGQIGPIDNSGIPNDVLKLNSSGNIVWGPVTGGSGANQIDQLLDGFHQNSSIALGFKPASAINFLNNISISNNLPPAITATAQNNINIGNSSLVGITDGTRNICIGTQAGNNINNATLNTIVGDRAANTNLITGSGNTLLGALTNVVSSNATNQIIIGNGAQGGVSGDNGLFFPNTLLSIAGSNQRIMAFNPTNGQVGPLSSPGLPNQVLTSNGSSASWEAPNSAVSILLAYGSAVFQNINTPGANLTIPISWSTASTGSKFSVSGDTITISATGAGVYEVTTTALLYLINVTGVGNNVTLRTVLNASYDTGSFLTQKIPTTSEYAGTITNTWIRTYSANDTIKVNVLNSTSAQLQMDKINVTVKFLST
jgi:hypothetical protein